MGQGFSQNRRIGVLAGGASSEREISLKSGKAVYEALSEMGINSVFIDASKEGLLNEIERLGVDVAFIALHGKFGEDGDVQQLLSSAGIPYTGSRAEASRIAFDKIKSKKKFLQAGLLVPEFKKVALGDDIAAVFDGMSTPCVVKPRFEGSSMGLSVVTEPGGIFEAVDLAFTFGREAIVEDFIPGRELTVGILEDKALPVVEIIPAGGVYDYGSKYSSLSTRYVVPAKICPDLYFRAQEAGLNAHKVLGCRGFSRTDIRITPDGDLYILEVNTIPGLTEKSLLPMAAMAAGVDFKQLCVKMLKSALA
jgi:D-alanine-D-alanine ligase